MIDRMTWKAMAIVPLAAAMSVIAAARAGADETAEPPAGDRLDFMKKSVAVYSVTGDPAAAMGEAEYQLRPEPLLRWDNPVSKVPDGTLFLWTDRSARPIAIVQVFIAANTKDLWLHEFQSLSSKPFEVRRGSDSVWTPRRGGIGLKPLADAAVPAGTKPARLTQMRQLAKRFEAQDDFEGTSRWELRLLATPLHRYGQEESEVVDGAIFAFAHGTDPEALLVLEARQEGTGLAWHYALAPMTGYALRVKDQGQEVWAIDWRKPPYDPQEPFLCIPYKP